jgi:hypothetical protein
MKFPVRASLPQVLAIVSFSLVLPHVTADQEARDNGPPPSDEDYMACEGRLVGDIFKRYEENGDVVWSACYIVRDRLAAQPAHRHGTKPTNAQPKPSTSKSGGQGAP